MLKRSVGFFLSILIIASSCTEKPGGGIIRYDTIYTHVIVDSITTSPNHLLCTSLFKESDIERFRRTASLTEPSFFNAIRGNCLPLDFISTGDTLSAKLMLIVEGTATPIVFKILDYPECF